MDETENQEVRQTHTPCEEASRGERVICLKEPAEG